jgi:hypothetical protein
VEAVTVFELDHEPDWHLIIDVVTVLASLGAVGIVAVGLHRLDQVAVGTKGVPVFQVAEQFPETGDDRVESDHRKVLFEQGGKLLMKSITVEDGLFAVLVGKNDAEHRSRLGPLWSHHHHHCSLDRHLELDGAISLGPLSLVNGSVLDRATLA